MKPRYNQLITSIKKLKNLAYKAWCRGSLDKSPILINTVTLCSIMETEWISITVWALKVFFRAGLLCLSILCQQFFTLNQTVCGWLVLFSLKGAIEIFCLDYWNACNARSQPEYKGCQGDIASSLCSLLKENTFEYVSTWHPVNGLTSIQTSVNYFNISVEK